MHVPSFVLISLKLQVAEQLKHQFQLDSSTNMPTFNALRCLSRVELPLHADTCMEALFGHFKPFFGLCVVWLVFGLRQLRETERLQRKAVTRTDLDKPLTGLRGSKDKYTTLYPPKLRNS